MVHALLNYKAAHKIWRLVYFAIKFPQAINLDMPSIIQEMARDLSKKEFAQMVAYCWAAWHARNRFVFEGKKLDSLLSFAKAEAIIEAYQRVRLSRQTHIDKKDIGAKEK